MAKYQEENPSEELIEHISAYLRVGADYLLATAACGVPEQKAIEWQSKAASAKDGIYQDLHETIRSSSAHAEVIALQRLAAEGGAAGAKWLLEKLYPGKYGVAKKVLKSDKAIKDDQLKL